VFREAATASEPAAHLRLAVLLSIRDGLMLECAGNRKGRNRWHEGRLKCVPVTYDFRPPMEFQFHMIL